MQICTSVFIMSYIADYSVINISDKDPESVEHPLLKYTIERMEYATGIILAQTVVVCIISTVAIMWCFFEEEPRKQKTD